MPKETTTTPPHAGRRLRIKEAFGSYRNEVVPGDAHHVQVQETRRAFYAGAKALLGMAMSNNSLYSTDFLADIGTELDEFLVDVLAGRA